MAASGGDGVLVVWQTATMAARRRHCPYCGEVVEVALMYGHILSWHHRVPRPEQATPPATDEEVVIVHDPIMVRLVAEFVRAERRRQEREVEVRLDAYMREFKVVVARRRLLFNE
jgi:extradiol dioxygenase family protein